MSASVHRMPGQVLPLAGLRLRMVRSGRTRAVLVVLLLLPALLATVGVLMVDLVPDDRALGITLTAPTVYLAFAVLAFMAPLAAGGGYELYPPEQLVAYPVRPRTVFFGTLLLAPINLAWMLNVVGLVVLTSFAAGPTGWGTVRATVSLLLFVALATAAGHATAWWVVGVRQTRIGRRAVWAAAAFVGVTLLALIRLGYTFTLLNASPTKYALINALQGYHPLYRRWFTGMVVMALLTAACLALGVRATAWALRRPGDHAVGDAASPVRRRAARSTLLRELVSVDRASVWRSVPLRRGLLVLLLLPATVAALAGMSWASLVLLPGLVAAGAGLLFGVNAFCLDAGGVTWLATLPGWERWAFAAKAWVVSEVVALAVTAALLGGALRAPSPGSATPVVATIGSAVAVGSLVVASSMRASLRHPHQADLRGPRDTPAPPGVMALHSLRLAVLTTFVGLLFSGTTIVSEWWLPLVLAIPFVSWSGLSLVDSARAWSAPDARARVVTTVAGG